MISYIKGLLTGVEEDAVVVETGGIGLLVYVPASVTSRLPKTGSPLTLHTYFQVREDAMNLYGFLNRQDLDMFRLLIGVNGIGPKGALGVLSALSPDDLRIAIVSGDAKAITRAPGIGAKTAQRVILDLKDKVSLEDVTAISLAGEEISAGSGLTASAKEAAEALAALGYSASEAAKAVKRVEVTEDMTAEDVLKASLKHLSFL